MASIKLPSNVVISACDKAMRDIEKRRLEFLIQSFENSEQLKRILLLVLSLGLYRYWPNPANDENLNEYRKKLSSGHLAISCGWITYGTAKRLKEMAHKVSYIRVDEDTFAMLEEYW